LGVNGAGKTTTLSVLTGDTNPTAGDAYVAGHDVTGQTPGGVEEARKSIGFCPQTNPLLDLMTGWDTLLMFGKLRGIPSDRLEETVNDLISALTLTPHAHKPSCSYSGGNKRKLSLGIAIIGDPDVLFIDEASSGMDPVSRRKMWELLANVAERRSVILTTHSMEEAEALCTRVAIMTSGRMRCLGSVQHLKNRFVGGYVLDMQCEMMRGGDGEGRKEEEEIVDKVQAYILNVALKGVSVLTERHGPFLRFDVCSNKQEDEEKHEEELMKEEKGGAITLGVIFRTLESMKVDERFRIVDYSVSQCTLEQVFLSLAKDEEHNMEEME